MGDMLVVDCVEHHIIDHVYNVGHLEDEGSVRRQQPANAGDYVGQIVDMSKDVVSAEQRRWPLFGIDLRGKSACKEIRYGRDALMGRRVCDFAGWVDSLHAHTLGLERLEQRTVIAADFHNKAVF